MFQSPGWLQRRGKLIIISLSRQKGCKCNLLKYQFKHLLMNTLCLFSFKYPHSENSSHSEFPLSSYGQGGQIPYRTERILQSFSRLSSWKTTTSLVLIINSFVFWKDTSWQGLQNPLWPTQTDHLHILKPAVLNLSIWCSNLKVNPPHRKSVHVHICAKYHYNFRKLRDPLKLIHGPQVKNLCSKPGWGQILETPPKPAYNFSDYSRHLTTSH